MEFHLQQNDHRTTCADERRSGTELADVMQFSSSPLRLPMSPGTPWAMSPARRSTSRACSSQSVVYHCIASLHRPDGNILSMTVTKELIFIGSESGRIHAWKLPECSGMGYIKASSGQVQAMFACERMLFTSHGDCRVRLWNVTIAGKSCKSKKMMITLPPKRLFLLPKKNTTQQHKHPISCLAYNIADKLLYTGSWDCTVKAWNVSENRCVDSFTAHESRVNAMVINQEDDCVFTCSSDGSVKIWRRVFGESSHILIMILKFHLSPINALALSNSSSPQTCFLYSGSSDGLINFWEKDNSSGRYNHGGFLQGHHFAVLCLVTVNGLILSGSEDTEIRVWRREEGNCFHSCLSVIDGHHGPVRCLAAAAESDNMGNIIVCSASLDRNFKVWRVRVFPGEKPAAGMDCRPEMNAVLSPSWVEKRKLHCS